MNYELSDDQASVLSALDSILSAHQQPPIEAAAFHYGRDLDAILTESGFLDIAREEGFGVLDAALIVERVARVPLVVEVAASTLLAPALGIAPGTRPVAVHAGAATDPIRFLPMASRLVLLHHDHAQIVSLESRRVEHVETMLAYPYGRIGSLEGLPVTVFDDPALIRRRWRIGIAAEAAGCMASALDVVLEHVKARFAFGRALGSMQAIQHRLAMAAETVESTKWLALRAAWSDSESDAAIACGFAQGRIAQFTYDLHQFSGAMGLTLEFPLHFWTYRLRALAGELGGASAQARAAATLTWGEAA